MDQLIWIVQKSIIKLQAIFESGLVTSRINSAFKGYQKSFPKFVESAQASNKSEETCVPVNVDLEDPAVKNCGVNSMQLLKQQRSGWFLSSSYLV